MTLDPDPFQHHPKGCWETLKRATAVAAITDALARFDAGLISLAGLRDDKNEAGIKYWLWYALHPDHAVWKKVGRPYWSKAAYSVWHRVWHAMPAELRQDRRGRPTPATIPGKVAGRDWLVHEHVVPQAVMLNLIIGQSRDRNKPTTRMPVAAALSLNLGCVITRGEDLRLKEWRHTHPDPSDPWRRYAGTGIVLVDNPAWTQAQRSAVALHGLLE